MFDPHILGEDPFFMIAKLNLLSLLKCIRATYEYEREMGAMLTAFFPSLLQTKTHLFTSPVWESFRWAPATTWQDAYDGEEATKENPCGRFST